MIGASSEPQVLIALQTSRWKALAMLAPSALLLWLASAIAQVLLGTRSPMWWVVALIAALGLAALALVAVRLWRPTVLELHPEGLRVLGVIESYQLKWTQVVSAYRHAGGQGPARVGVQWTPAAGGSHTTFLPWGWTVSPDRLVRVLRAAQEASRAGADADVLAAVKGALSAPTPAPQVPAALLVLVFSPILIGWAAMLFIYAPAQNDPVKKMRALGLERTREVIALCGEGYFHGMPTVRLREALRDGECRWGKRRPSRYLERRRERLEAERRAEAAALRQ